MSRNMLVLGHLELKLVRLVARSGLLAGFLNPCDSGAPPSHRCGTGCLDRSRNARGGCQGKRLNDTS
jgi:hypothetical protein